MSCYKVPFSHIITDEDSLCWIIGDNIVQYAAKLFFKPRNRRLRYDAIKQFYKTKWFAKRGLKLNEAHEFLVKKLNNEEAVPDYVIFHVGSNDIEQQCDFQELGEKIRITFDEINSELMNRQREKKGKGFDPLIIWSDILPRLEYKGITHEEGIARTELANAYAHLFAIEMGHKFMKHVNIQPNNKKLFRAFQPGQDVNDKVSLSDIGYRFLINKFNQKMEEIYKGH